ncbi:hypothetical protein CW702_00860 [Candidatus Bathyarchaeota archaeon]|nr:MAG: hypothetical protein CW702_00860 [Candidatus Bathyarchaeota archaeon]
MKGAIMKRAPSGIPGLDDLIQGGFPRGTNVLLMGAPMTGKSTMAMQFLYKGLTYGDAGIFISTSDTAEDVRARMSSFGWDPAPYEEKGVMKYVDCYGMMVDSKLRDTPSIKRVPSLLSFTSMSVALSELSGHFWKMRKNVRIVLDSVSSLLMYTNPEAVVRFLHVLLGKFKRINAVSILILEEGMHDKRVETTLQQLSDGTFRLIRKNGDRFLICLGLASTKCTTQEIPITITDEGLKVIRREI